MNASVECCLLLQIRPARRVVGHGSCRLLSQCFRVTLRLQGHADSGPLHAVPFKFAIEGITQPKPRTLHTVAARLEGDLHAN